MKHQAAFYVLSKGQRIRIPIQELQFVEIRTDGCILHLLHTHVTTEEPPESVWSRLPADHFLPVRRKFMINLHYIAGICDHYIHLHTGRIPQRDRQTGSISAHWMQPAGVAI
ncbi:LytTR family transcriptional regulator DNA-binding domain-containing protein [Chitinophaga rhizophila]|uniref:LytTR family transcriptional regulator DNA-binding domain-containing protein n=1 Tax=Chitinophaga rhizophila TaxID=2866212 RepID=A0ABS7G9S4_9BACT|nr:LytTR family transcriptional regulator DNA-binding domain-containing protein [Chitinophaga rhizophila]MBW8684413.1 LytTR family transcriptional regulator DNA-binding domain-containing protein [Chitinophaga rhizophila]